MNFPATRLLTPPEFEPVTTAEAKAHLKVTHTDDDDYIDTLIASARHYIEVGYDHAIAYQKWGMYPKAFPACDYMTIPYGGLRDILLFQWIDTAGTVRRWTVSGSNLIDSSSVIRAHIDTNCEPGRIQLAYGEQWPNETLRTANPITIEFTCGAVDASLVPAEVKHAMKLLIGHWYRNREAVVVTDRASVESQVVPLAVSSLLANYRLYCV